MDANTIDLAAMEAELAALREAVKQAKQNERDSLHDALREVFGHAADALMVHTDEKSSTSGWKGFSASGIEVAEGITVSVTVTTQKGTRASK